MLVPNDTTLSGLHTVSGADVPVLFVEGDEAFVPVQNFKSVSGKPRGGLTLRLADGSSDGVRLRDDATVAVVDSQADWMALAASFGEASAPGGAAAEWMRAIAGQRLDFEQLAARFDAFWLTAAGIESCKVGHPTLTMWGGETVLVLREGALG